MSESGHGTDCHFSSSHQVWSHAGHANRPLRHHVSAGQPVPAVPILHLPVPAQHVCGRGQSLAAPAQVGSSVRYTWSLLFHYISKKNSG